MKKSLLLFFAIAISGLLSAQTTPVIGSTAYTKKCFLTKQLIKFPTAHQDFPEILKKDTTYFITWAQNGAPVTVRKSEMDSVTNTTAGSNPVVTSTGGLNTLNGVDQAFAILPNGLRLQVYVNTQNNQHGLYGIVYYKNVIVNNVFKIEGQFTSATSRPRAPQVTSDGVSKFFVAYHSGSSSTTTPSVIRLKIVDVSGVAIPVLANPLPVTVTPTSTTTVQNGFVISDVAETQAYHPKIAYSAANNEIAVVYQSGSGSSSVIRFATVNTNGSIKLNPVTINDLGAQADYPNIVTDGSNYAVTWRDFRNLNVNSQTLNNKGAIRFTKLSTSGVALALTHSNSALFSGNDKSLLVSNPYQAEAGMYSDIVLKTSNQTYGIVWSTQSNTASVYFCEAFLNGTAVNSSIPTMAHAADGYNNDKPSIACVHKKYVIAYTGYDAVYSYSVTKLAVENKLDTTLVTYQSSKLQFVTSQDDANPSLFGYQWYNCTTQSTVGLPNGASYFEPSVAGSYAVILNNSTCVDTSQCLTFIDTRLNEWMNKNKSFKVMPNPFKENITVSSNLNITTLVIQDLLGKEVLRFSDKTFSKQISLSELKSGVYFITAEFDNNNRITHKIIKE
ncbi:MAG: T9SS type A sorting domain-containing protein [Bacteroidia bacterium]|nr:T9SS type A sorting domain-containing protein [Bacteroidia bacterium]